MFINYINFIYQPFQPLEKVDPNQHLEKVDFLKNIIKGINLYLL